jgi:ribosomal protein S18 acetylase RimI-like enzyme
MEVIIRKLAETDKPQMRGLIKEFWMDYNRGKLLSPEVKVFEKYKNFERTFETELDLYLQEITYVAEEEDKLVGYVVGRIKEEQDRTLDRLGSIDQFFVTEAKRNLGIGRQLLDTLVEDLKANKCIGLEIYAYASNKEVIEMYKRHGFNERTVGLVKKI